MCDSSDGSSGGGSDAEKEVRLQQAISAFMQPPFFNDICIRIVTTDLTTGLRNEEHVLANKFLLAFFSLHLRELILNGILQIDGANGGGGGGLQNMPTIELYLGAIANAGQAFRVILRYLYTGVLAFNTVHPFQVLQVSRICQIPMVEIQLAELVKNFLSVQLDENGCLIRQQNVSLTNSNSNDSRKQRTFDAMKNETVEVTGIGAESAGESNDLLDTSPTESKPTVHCTSAEKFNELILPSSDKEGWCRNKKYIEQVTNGYMCTVCRKVYGRYNSVSYHVTIYHRNPPIKCDERGCAFRTREARYIHFHKYYRHHIPLPDNIDLGSRKCPFCRHVSKSPAMLEKHINRHVQDVDRAVSASAATATAAAATTSVPIAPSVMHFSRYPQNTANFRCSKCNYRGRTSGNLEKHKLFAHSSEVFRRKQSAKDDGSTANEITNEANVSNDIFERAGEVLLVDAMKRAERMVEMKTIVPAPPVAAAAASAMQSEAMCLVTPKA